jgi:hypothetical protein
MEYPPTIIFGTKPPELRLKHRNGTQTYFCTRNDNLHLRPLDFIDGTFQAGKLLAHLCSKHCSPLRRGDEPCRAFVSEYKVGVENKGLADVTMRRSPEWDQCAGVAHLLSLCQTEDERHFLLEYLTDQCMDEAKWRNHLVATWNAHWHRVPNGAGASCRRARFGGMLWQTLRFPALIPQVWLNWVYGAPEVEQRLLDENPSRVDFVAFWKNQGHIIEIDGPSHYASWNDMTHEYTVDERMYARNLKIERSLRRDGWVLTRIGRHELRAARDESFFGAMEILSVLPFHENDYGEQPSIGQLGLREIDEVEMAFAV